MIKFLELTPPQGSEFRQAKIISIEVKEGDTIEVSTPLFIVKSGKQEIPLPSTLDGTVVEVIANVDQSITTSTPLLLLKTQVEGNDDKANDKPVEAEKPKNSNKLPSQPKQHQQQSLDLDDTLEADKTKQTKLKQSDTDNQQTLAITVPDIGTESAKIIELLVSVGDSVAVDDPLMTLESDKASMDLPATAAGTISAITVKVDNEVSEGDIVLELTVSNDSLADSEKAETNNQSKTVAKKERQPNKQIIDINIPDIGSDEAKVIDILIKSGDKVSQEDPLVSLESDKASMEVPSPASGVIKSIAIELGQAVQQGALIATIETDDTQSSIVQQAPEQSETPVAAQAASSAATPAKHAPAVQNSPVPSLSVGRAHASPSIRRFARELGIDLARVVGTGRKGRIQKSDVKQFVKGIMTGASQTAQAHSSAIPPVPAVDFSKFGEIDVQPLNRIKRITATNLHRSWLNIPHVTHNDEANIDDLEDFRKQLNAEYKKQQQAIKLSPLAFIVKAVVQALQAYPQFNSSLDESGENLIYKQYFNIGIAVDTPNGLVVPVIKEADKKLVSEIATEMAELASKARDKKLSVANMSGGCFTISSLGGIGGTHFTPIINAPEVAILGVSRSKIQPHWDGKAFQPSMMLPLSLSYDHRVIDGAEAARFTRLIATSLEDVRRLTI